MPYLTAARFVQVVDKVGKGYYALKGDGANLGVGDNTLAQNADYGLSRAVRDLESVQLGWQDYDLDVTLRDICHNLQNLSPIQKIAPNVFNGYLQQFKVACVNAAAGLTNSGISDINSFATYYNIGAGGPYNALCPPEYAAAHLLCFGVALSPTNIYAPPATYTNLGSRAFGGSFTSGTTIDQTAYAGAAQIEATVTGWSGTSGTVTVQGTARNSAGQVVTSRTWSVPINNNGNFILTPANAGDLCIQVTGITLPGSMTGGTVTIQAIPPAGRNAAPPG